MQFNQKPVIASISSLKQQTLVKPFMLSRKDAKKKTIQRRKEEYRILCVFAPLFSLREIPASCGRSLQCKICRTVYLQVQGSDTTMPNRFPEVGSTKSTQLIYII